MTRQDTDRGNGLSNVSSLLAHTSPVSWITVFLPSLCFCDFYQGHVCVCVCVCVCVYTYIYVKVWVHTCKHIDDLRILNAPKSKGNALV